MKYKPELPKTGWYTYGLFLDGTPFYVGKGSGDRALNHFYPSYLRHGSNPWKSYIINKHRSNVEIQILTLHDKEEDAFRTEEFLIRSYGLREDGGVLVNRTKGGEGSSGVIVDDELRLRRGRNIRKFSDEQFMKSLEDYYLYNMSQINVAKNLGIHQTNFSLAIRGKTETLIPILEKFKQLHPEIDYENYSQSRRGFRNL